MMPFMPRRSPRTVYEVRSDLAAACRLAALAGWEDTSQWMGGGAGRKVS